MQVSTDYVFHGDGTSPTRWTTTRPAQRVRAHQARRRAGRARRLPGARHVVRTAWVYGAHGATSSRRCSGWRPTRATVSVVDDQRGSPTWSADLARRAGGGGAAPGVTGLLHATNTGATTWYGSPGRCSSCGADPERVQPTTTDAFPRPAPRPAYSVLDPASWTAAGLPALPPWRESLRACLAQLGALRPDPPVGSSATGALRWSGRPPKARLRWPGASPKARLRWSGRRRRRRALVVGTSAKARFRWSARQAVRSSV